MSIVKCKCDVNAENMARTQQFMDEVQAKGDKALVNATALLAMQIRYVVIPLSASGNISNAQIQANHSVLNLHYLANQTSTLFPSNTAHYPYQNIMGDPGFVFEPDNPADVTEDNGYILRMSQPTSPPASYDTVSDLETEFLNQGGVIEPGVIYVYISTLSTGESGILLGVAKDIISNACAVHFGTVGSDTLPGPISAYGEGKTLVHELGHCFGLYHPFSLETGAGACTAEFTTFIHSQNPQSPVQINPNQFADIDLVTTTDNALDNRGRDELRFCTGDPSCATTLPSDTMGVNPGGNTSDPQYSCTTSTELQSVTLPYETFMIFMDYGDDRTMLGFPSFTVNTMRTVVINRPDLFDSVVVPEVTAVPSFPEPPASESSAFPTWAIVVISVVGGLLFIGLIVYFGYFKGSGANRSKLLAAYGTPFLGRTFV